MKKMILIALLFVMGNAYAYDDGYRWEDDRSGFRVDVRYKEGRDYRSDGRYRRDYGRRSEEFSYPTVNGMPLDWCLSQGWVCGREPAQRWCEDRGFRRVVDFRASRWTGQTRYIDSGDIQYNGTSYEYIRCR